MRQIGALNHGRPRQDNNFFFNELIEDNMDETVCAGRSFCLGLFDYFRLNTESAMHHLLASKRSPKWRIPSVHIMIKLCLGN